MQTSLAQITHPAIPTVRSTLLATGLRGARPARKKMCRTVEEEFGRFCSVSVSDGAIQEARRASAIRPCLAKQSFEINFSLRIIDLILISFVIPLPAFFAVSCPHAFFLY